MCRKSLNHLRPFSHDVLYLPERVPLLHEQRPQQVDQGQARVGHHRPVEAEQEEEVPHQRGPVRVEGADEGLRDPLAEEQLEVGEGGVVAGGVDPFSLQEALQDLKADVAVLVQDGLKRGGKVLLPEKYSNHSPLIVLEMNFKSTSTQPRFLFR